MNCKNCGGEIMERVVQGKGQWYHCVDFGDCIAEPGGEVYVPIICRFCGEIDEGNPCWKCKRDIEEDDMREHLERPQDGE